MKAMISNQNYTTVSSGENANAITVSDIQLDLKDYYSTNSISPKTQDKMNENDFVILPSKYDDRY